MANYLYLFMNICVFLPLFILSYLNVWGIQVRKTVIWSFLFVSVPFIVWDAIVTALGHWSFSNAYTLGYSFLGIPIEEFLFFFTVPFACMYVWEALRKLRPGKLRHPKKVYLIALGLVVVYGLFLVLNGGDYSRIAGISLIIFAVIAYRFGWFARMEFWRFQALLYILFIAFNTILTALPVVTYGDFAITGLRFFTIPIEDFAYNFVLINGSLLIYEYFNNKN